MNRSLLLLVAFAAAAGGLGFFVLRTPTAPPDPNGPSDTDVEPGVTTKETKPPAQPTALADVDTAPSAPRATRGGKAKRWRVMPMNNLGQSWPTAVVKATQGGELLEGLGNVTFESVPSGEWDLVVEVEGQPLWERRVALEPGSSSRTIAYVDEEIRISGTVVDTESEAVDAEYILFMPSGVMGPNSSEANRIRATRTGTVTTDSGIVATRTTQKTGRFTLKLPSAGAYRVTVGDPERPRWIQRQSYEITHGGPDKATVRIPASASVTLNFSGSEDECPSQVSAYVFDADLAARLESERAERAANGKGGGGADVSRAQRLARREALRERLKDQGRKVDDEMLERMLDAKSAKPLGKQNRETFERNMDLYGENPSPVPGEAMRAPLFEPGWRPVRSARFEEGSATLRNLPDGARLRFLFVRNRERHTTGIEARPRAGVRSTGTVRLPEAPSDTNEQVRSSYARVTLEPPASDVEAPKPSVQWTVGRR